MGNIKIAPSLLAADWGHLAEEVKRVEQADLLHLDVMDGHFVPNISFGPNFVQTVRKLTTLPLSVHLMVTRPHDFIQQFVEAGADKLTIHVEAEGDHYRTLSAIREAGLEAGIALSPATPVGSVEELLPIVDFVLLMTVSPGFGGQAFIPEMLTKIRRMRSLAGELPIAVDGGITPELLGEVAEAGAKIVVAGSALFKEQEINWHRWQLYES